MPDQNCPLCGGPAKIVGVDFGRKKRIDCTTCKSIVIDSESERFAAKIKQAERDVISKRAAAVQEDFLLLIWVAHGTDESGRAQERLSWEPQPAGNWS